MRQILNLGQSAKAGCLRPMIIITTTTTTTTIIIITAAPHN
jgi:hypothetical protein